MKILNFILALMFLLFAFVQINDPDPVLWIAIYGLMAVVCILAIFKYYIKPLLWVMMAGFLVYMVLLFPGVKEWFAQPDLSILFDDVLKMQFPYIEEAREFLGLVICEVVAGMQLFRAYKSK